MTSPSGFSGRMPQRRQPALRRRLVARIDLEAGTVGGVASGHVETPAGLGVPHRPVGLRHPGLGARAVAGPELDPGAVDGPATGDVEALADRPERTGRASASRAGRRSRCRCRAAPVSRRPSPEERTSRHLLPGPRTGVPERAIPVPVHGDGGAAGAVVAGDRVDRRAPAAVGVKVTVWWMMSPGESCWPSETGVVVLNAPTGGAALVRVSVMLPVLAMSKVCVAVEPTGTEPNATRVGGDGQVAAPGDRGAGDRHGHRSPALRRGQRELVARDRRGVPDRDRHRGPGARVEPLAGKPVAVNGAAGGVGPVMVTAEVPVLVTSR